jgi:hypothetical protein
MFYKRSSVINSIYSGQFFSYKYKKFVTIAIFFNFYFCIILFCLPFQCCPLKAQIITMQRNLGQYLGHQWKAIHISNDSFIYSILLSLVCTFFRENYNEILPAHYTWKVPWERVWDEQIYALKIIVKLGCARYSFVHYALIHTKLVYILHEMHWDKYQ